MENLYQALETKQLPIEALSPRILSLKARQDQLTAAREEAEAQLEQRRAELPTSREIKGYVADFREFLQEGTFPERKALIRNFVQGIEIVEDEAVLTYTIPMPSDGVTSESASVLDFVQSGPPWWTRTEAHFHVLARRPHGNFLGLPIHLKSCSIPTSVCGSRQAAFIPAPYLRLTRHHIRCAKMHKSGVSWIL